MHPSDSSSIPLSRGQAASPSYGTDPSVRKRPLVSTKDALWFVYLDVLRPVSNLLGPGVMYGIGRLLEPVAQLATRGRKRTASDLMRQAVSVGLRQEAIPGIAKRFVSNAIWRALDDLTLSDPDASRRLPAPEIHGLPHLEAALAGGKGVILTSGHFYANRLGKRHLASAGYPVLSVRNGRPDDEWMGRLGAQFLQRRYFEFLQGIIGEEVYIQDPECSLKIFRRLRAGGIVNVHVDSNYSRQYLDVPFLGEPRPFATGLMEIVRLSGCAVVPMLCLGNQSGFRIEFEEALRMTTAESREEFARLNVPALARALERQVLAHPEEWESWVRL